MAITMKVEVEGSPETSK